MVTDKFLQGLVKGVGEIHKNHPLHPEVKDELMSSILDTLLGVVDNEENDEVKTMLETQVLNVINGVAELAKEQNNG